MLKEILSISGKPGLQKLISNSSNAIIVESLIDGKRFPAYSNSKIIALEDISIYTEAEDMPLKEVFKRISAKENGKSALSHKEPTEKILAYFEEIVPEYDKERVYVSDMKKSFSGTTCSPIRECWTWMKKPKKKRKKKHNLLLKHKEVGVPRKAFGPSQLLFISDTDVSIQAIRHPSRTYSDESRNRRCIIRSVGRA